MIVAGIAGRAPGEVYSAVDEQERGARLLNERIEGRLVLLAGTIVNDKGYVGTTTDLASNRNLDWYWYARIFPTWTGAIAATSQPFPNSGLPLDIRSRRVIKDMGRTAILALTNGSGTSKTVDVFTRTLIGLP